MEAFEAMQFSSKIGATDEIRIRFTRPEMVRILCKLEQALIVNDFRLELFSRQQIEDFYNNLGHVFRTG